MGEADSPDIPTSSREVSNPPAETPTHKTNSFWRNLRADADMKLYGYAVPLTAGISCISFATGKWGVGIATALSALGEAYMTKTRHQTLNRENRSNAEEVERKRIVASWNEPDKPNEQH